jgi:hypothetical protein
MDDLVILVTGAVVGIVVFNLVTFAMKKKDN